MRTFRQGPMSFSAYAERLMSVTAVVWGLWFWLLESSQSIHAYYELTRFVPPWGISVYFIAWGLAVLLLKNPGYRRLPHAALIAGWQVIAWAFFFHDTSNTGGVTYLSIALLEVGLYIRAHILSTLDNL